MDKFKEWFASQDFYTNMLFIHGDGLFVKDGDVYRVLPVQMTWEVWQSRQTEVEEKEKRITELEKSEFALAKVKQILNKHIKTRLLESIIVRELIDLLFSNKGRGNNANY
ncbi:hypothetical protein ACG9X6_14125 [Acinetobacter guillouiae]|uniref:hypothetical protein n=1 Tax=Acinetobacter TaxID=469 RepID=UPI001FBAC2B6|nr:hypothetical protein [Acinetobacter sp. NyZ410]UOH17197.1 hypothetical protein MTO68_15375 [Acinetobacter sp. NyZ410]